MKIAETERLVLRLVNAQDAPFILELLNSPGWLQFIGDRNVHTLEQAHFYIQNSFQKTYDRHGYGMYLVERKEDNKPIGVSGLVQRDYFTGPDIGYAFLPAFGGQGYALEAAKAVVAFAQQSLNVQTLLAMTLPENEKSIQLLEKLGFTFKNSMKDPNTQEDLNLYEVHLSGAE